MPDRVLDAALVVDHEFLGQDVEHLAIGRQRDRARRFEHALDVARRDLAAPHRDHAVHVEALDVAAGRSRDHAADLAAGHQLGLVDGLADRLDRGVDVDHGALLEPAWTPASRCR